MKIDYHTHHDRCGHAQGSLRDMIESAIRLGLDQIGLSDHSPFFNREEDHPVPGMTMAKSEFALYVEEMVRLRDEYRGRIDVRLGVESDYFHGWAEEYGRIYAGYPLDYIMGSVHYLNGNGFHVFSPKLWKQEGLQIEKTYSSYIRLIQEAARCGQFDILGHMDAVKGLNILPEGNLHELWDVTARIIADADIAVEINSSGLRKPCGSWFPSIEIIERLVSLKVPLTFGSDAHAPEQLAYELQRVTDTVRELGVREWATFQRRRRIMVPLPSRML
ncbi:histidinol-phosphatase [Paenibacillus sp. UNC451MF]|uniref:histidinol-phosphatase n=1 Tax=Paenibacillus sp. UNC451MF TaxID=1449063 RepID=UPI00048A53A2|nr:histidinol-phosphatase [Paenibacillus sp. UNC451MF]